MEEQLKHAIVSVFPQRVFPALAGEKPLSAANVKRFAPTAAVGILIAFTPVLYGSLAAPSNIIADPADLFIFSIGNVLPLLFVFYAALLYVPVVLQETQAAGWMPIIARRGRSSYIGTHVVRSAAIGALAFGSAIGLAAMWAFAIAPAFDQVAFMPEQRVLPVAEDMTFSQFAHTGTWKFVVFMIFWTAFHGMLYTVLFTALAMHLRNPFLALLLGPAVVFLVGTTLAIAQLEMFMPDNAVLPTGLEQGPLHEPVITTCVVLLTVLGTVGFTLWSPRLPRALQ